ncbi:MAG: hypothetical protein HY518_02205 [Candidatus Aenigmarchaeota archaeon]|nr:hypothetical protein [Candidatus Aenigmarchaeota archaeon]
MQESVTIPLTEYRELKHKVDMLKEILEEEKLTMEELEDIKRAEKTKRVTKEEFYSRHPELKG